MNTVSPFEEDRAIMRTYLINNGCDENTADVFVQLMEADIRNHREVYSKRMKASIERQKAAGTGRYSKKGE
jgi:hypothetical protein